MGTVPNVEEGEFRTWQAADAAVRERLRALERESDRARDTLHTVRGEVQTIRYLAEKIAELAEDVKVLAGRVESVSRQAVHRPSQSALGVLGQYIALIVSIVAIILASRR